MKTDEIKGLLEKYYKGETSLEEEKILGDYLLNQNTSSDMDDDRQLFAMFAETKNDPVPEIDLPLPVEQKARLESTGTPLPWYYATAAAVAFLITGFSTGLYVGSRNNTDDLVALRQDLNEIKSLAVINRLNAESPSERILATYEAGSDNNAGKEIISALINTMALDENVNVRIAAADALFRFGNEETVRKGFIQALKVEKDPNLQIRLINMLVNLQEKRALPNLQEMMENQDYMQVVRETAAHGVALLL